MTGTVRKLDLDSASVHYAKKLPLLTRPIDLKVYHIVYNTSSEQKAENMKLNYLLYSGFILLGAGNIWPSAHIPHKMSLRLQPAPLSHFSVNFL